MIEDAYISDDEAIYMLFDDGLACQQSLNLFLFACKGDGAVDVFDKGLCRTK